MRKTIQKKFEHSIYIKKEQTKKSGSYTEPSNVSRVIPHASSNSYNYTPKRVYHHTPIFAIQGWFFEKESEFLINFTVITYQVKSTTV